jgi:ferredoxin
MPALKPQMAKHEDPNENRAVFVDEISCIGCKQCVFIAAATFRLEQEHGRSRVFAQVRAASLRAAAAACCRPAGRPALPPGGALLGAGGPADCPPLAPAPLQWIDNEETVQAAIDSCPVSCIHWVRRLPGAPQRRARLRGPRAGPCSWAAAEPGRERRLTGCSAARAAPPRRWSGRTCPRWST